MVIYDIMHDLRVRYGITQNQIARHMGVDQSTVSRLERGEIDSLVLSIAFIHALNELWEVNSNAVGTGNESDVGSDKQS